MKQKFNDDIFINAGYKKFNDNLYSALYGFQKKFTDEFGVKYFINVYKYNHYKTISHGPDEDSWVIKLQFELSLSTMAITLFSFKFSSIEEIENFVDDLWERVDAHYYEIY